MNFSQFVRFFFAALLYSISFCGYSQQVVLTGKILDKETQEPLPFANIFVKNNYTVGATADYDGLYTLTLDFVPDTIGVSTLGYTTLFKKYIANSSPTTLNFELDRSDVSLMEVVIKPGENPAHPIIRKVIANKTKYDKNNLNSYGFEMYNKIEIDLDELTEKFKNRKIFKPFQNVFNNIDSTSEEKPFLPFFLSETVSDFHFQKNPIDKREIIKATKVSGVKSDNLSQFLGGMYIQFNIYEDWVPLFQRQFLSPIAVSAFSSYKYYLVDSAFIENNWCYKIQFMPKRKGELTFEGDMWVVDSAFALKQISMKISKDADINFVRKVSIYNEFTEAAPDVWMLKKEKMIVNFIKPAKGPGMIGRKTTYYKNHLVNEQKDAIDSLFKKQKRDIQVAVNASEYSEKEWQSLRHDTLSQTEGRVYGMIDSLKNTPIVKTYLNIIQTIYTGYLDVGPVSFGNLWSYINWSDVEGWRFQYGMGTSNKFSKHVMINGYVAYGIVDKKVKYGGELLYLIKKNPRESIHIDFRNDITSTSNFDQFYSPGILGAIGVRRWEEGRRIPMKMMRIKEVKIDYFKEFDFGYSFKIGVAHRRLQPVGFLDSKFITSDNARFPNQTISSFNQTEISLFQRFSWQEKFISGEFMRTSLGSKYPELHLRYAAGLRDVLGSDFNYHKLDFGISDYQPCGPVGKLYWQVEVGKTFGVLPFQLLNSANTSESYVYNSKGFNLLKMYEMVTDRYVTVTLNHHFGGLLFNRIPYVRKLKLREAFTFRMIWGDMSKKNKLANNYNYSANLLSPANVQFMIPDKIPYMEAGVGIENILKFIRIDAFWRLTHLDKRGSPFSFKYGNFGVRLGFELQF